MHLCVWMQREITRKLTFPKQPTNPFLEMVKFLLERIAPVHIDSEAIRCVFVLCGSQPADDCDTVYRKRLCNTGVLCVRPLAVVWWNCSLYLTICCACLCVVPL